MKKRLTGASLAAIAVLLTAIPAISAEGFPPCGTFTLMGGEQDVTVFESGEEGDSVGDHRYGRLTLITAEGEAVGDLRFDAQVVDAGNDGNGVTIIHARHVYTLPEGTIHTSGQLLIEVFTDEEVPPLGVNTRAVIGGTGAYAGSRGEVISTFEPGELSRIDFELQCN